MRNSNNYAATCVDCNTFVEAQAGRLYRHHGANMRVNGRRVAQRRGAKFAYLVRCEPCYIRHDKPEVAAAKASKAQSKLNLDATLGYVKRTDDEDLGNPAYYCQKISQYIQEVIS